MPHFASLTSPQLGEIIARRPLAILPVGQIEEHGPHLPINADVVIAERVATAAAGRLEDLPCLLLPALWAGYSGRELAHWPGTIRVRTRVFADLVFDLVKSLCEMGIEKIVTVNGHGHHPALLEMAAREIADATGVYIACAEVAKMAAPAVAQYRQSAPGGCIHGGEFETSLLLHLGEPVDMSQAHSRDVFRYASDNFPGDGFAGGKKAFWSTWGIQRSETGIYGDPTCATAEFGRMVFEEAVKNLEAFCREYHGVEAADWG
ncbi:MAG: creatininase family protein [Armatimonadetes bacterium]|nr:creatininase family protein [Armatimonadota bacterium]